MGKKNGEEIDPTEFAGDDELQTEGMSFGDDNEGDGNIVDLSGVSEKGSFQAIPRGKYPVTVVGLEYGISQSKGNRMWTWQLEIESGEYQGRKLFYHTVFSDGGISRVKQALLRIQLEDGSDYAKQLANSSFNPEKVADEGRLVGGRFTADVVQRKYEGEMRNNVRQLFVPSNDQEGFLVA
jgi:hypothetical protein